MANPDPAPRPDEAPQDPAPPAPDPEEEQSGILPGKIPGQPTDPNDPRFPGSQPDLA